MRIISCWCLRQCLTHRWIQIGVYVYGLFLEGARWNAEVATLADSLPKVVHTKAPLIWFRPVRQGDHNSLGRERYECPVYKTR
jgi:dynein heavy chain